MKRLWIVVVALAFVCSAGAAHADRNAFHKADLNRDGKLDKEEFNKAVEKKFREYDKNGDGFLDASEIRDIQRSHPDVGVQKEFEKMDTNKDGKVDLQEFKDAANKSFDEADKGKTGSVDGRNLDYRGYYQDPSSVMHPFSGFYF